MEAPARLPGAVPRARHTPLVRLVLRLAGHLMLLQAVAGVPVFLFFDQAWLARALAGLYLLVAAYLGVALGRQLREFPGPAAWLAPLATGLIWQAPALLGSLMALLLYLDLDQYSSGNDLTDFVMQMWHTVLLPLFSALPARQWAYAAYYYWATVLAGPALLLLFVAAAATGRYWGRRR